MKKLLIRLRVCWDILTMKNQHWAIISLSKQDLVDLLRSEDFDIDITYHGLQPYIIDRMIDNLADQKNEVDMLESRLKFELEAEKHLKTKK